MWRSLGFSRSFTSGEFRLFRLVDATPTAGGAERLIRPAGRGWYLEPKKPAVSLAQLRAEHWQLEELP